MIVDHQKSVERYKVLLSLLTELFKISVPVGYMHKVRFILQVRSQRNDERSLYSSSLKVAYRLKECSRDQLYNVKTITKYLLWINWNRTAPFSQSWTFGLLARTTAFCTSMCADAIPVESFSKTFKGHEKCSWRIITAASRIYNQRSFKVWNLQFLKI